MVERSRFAAGVKGVGWFGGFVFRLGWGFPFEIGWIIWLMAGGLSHSTPDHQPKP
jgi:hypothetical protein